MIQEETQKETLRVLGQNPFEGIATKTRLRQLLQTHQGRDKLFKVAQYFLRVRLWWNSVDFNINYLPGEEFSRLEKNLMTIVNSRRMFKLGRFFAEIVRMHVTLIKASELVYIPVSGSQWVALFIQSQMILDMIARLLMFVKSLFEDVAFLVQKGFFHGNVAGKLIRIATRCGLPVLCIDLFLNTLRLYQGILDASTTNQNAGETYALSTESFSLLSKYDRVDKLRRKLAAQASASNGKQTRNDGGAGAAGRKSTPLIKEGNPLTAKASSPDAGEGSSEEGSEDSIVFVDSYAKLLWTDFELHWICVTQTKLLLDIFVATSNFYQWKGVQGPVSIAGFCSGLCSVYRVWTYGR
ncbi:hypothetical protein AGDE_10279 [Angomonas deanei]|nr:hypothetical protein AGDE_10279 [Angomonas deanei]|eukprot:EPY28794.1 hypothetical protein AGDE_10279 [Angomonas deanei]